MAKPFRVDIVSPEKTVFGGDAVSLIVPAEYGYLGVLADHAPFICKLADGKITLRDAEGNTLSFNSQGSGFLEVLKNNVTILLSQ